MQDFLEFDNITEAHKIGDKVEIIKGSSKGVTGHIGEIRHGLYKGAPKTYTVYHGDKDAAQVPKEHIRAIKNVSEEVKAKDKGEYDYEGEMAITQLKTICRHAEALQSKMTPDTNLPEWVQSKITLATDYMQTAHDYLMSELDEKYTLAQGKPPRDSGRFTPHDQRRVDTTSTGARIHTGTVYTGKNKPTEKPEPRKSNQVSSAMDRLRSRMKPVKEETAGDTYEEAQKHKENAEKYEKDSEKYHHNMSMHHEAMGRWHESKGRNSIADKEFNKADSHHEQGVNKALNKESVLEGRSDVVLQTTAANADENAKHIFKLRDEHGIYAQQGAGASHHILVPREHEEKARQILAAHLKEETKPIQPPSERSSAKHRILVTYSDPHHTAASMRKEKQQKHIRVPATDKRGNTIYQGEAQELAKKYMKKQGYKVHDTAHAGLVTKTTEL